MRFLVLASILLATLGSCSVTDTRVYDFERLGAPRAERYRRLVVHCSTDDSAKRAVIEQGIVERLAQGGVAATAAHRLAGARSGEAFRLGDVEGFDGLVWVGYGSYERETTRYPGYVEERVGYGPFGPEVQIRHVAPHVDDRWFLHTRIELVDAASDAVVWTAKADSVTRKRDGLRSLAWDLGGEILDILAD